MISYIKLKSIWIQEEVSEMLKIANCFLILLAIFCLSENVIYQNLYAAEKTNY